ncbi:MAG: 23S rRNA (pseudouridine(1915)-N(3))-methyltransferase RlmH [Candidatus Aquirickettsiella gammari]|uniref:Ribosomal RNA large subunit methyltransferase H n=1 Tax=Candidatus Aquirickettsiella gammari TaxID=2016198 RepID=A0A370CHG8_9COXI|nr:MAG: 23S rRNA (pseudouridine(1915)-N(3))-methyltransferase RlmH [Candidatus Aquirickettsiella gammari]
MLIHLIAVGTRLALRVENGFKDYQKRFPPECKLNLISIPLSKRTKNSRASQSIIEEEKKILAAIPKRSRIIALDSRGQMWNTRQLAQSLQQWQLERQDINLLIGGPDGLGPTCLSSAEHIWSLSALTLPHALVRILVAEQLYRAFSLLQGHPYHRE